MTSWGADMEETADVPARTSTARGGDVTTDMDGLSLNSKPSTGTIPAVTSNRGTGVISTHGKDTCGICAKLGITQAKD